MRGCCANAAAGLSARAAAEDRRGARATLHGAANRRPRDAEPARSGPSRAPRPADPGHRGSCCVERRSARLQSIPAVVAGRRTVCQGDRRAPAGASLCGVRAGTSRSMGTGQHRSEGNADARGLVHPHMAVAQASQHRQRRVGARVVLQLRQRAWRVISPVRSAGLSGESRVRAPAAARRAVAVRMGRAVEPRRQPARGPGAGHAGACDRDVSVRPSTGVVVARVVVGADRLARWTDRYDEAAGASFRSGVGKYRSIRESG
jgi:hypothetical protein